MFFPKYGIKIFLIMLVFFLSSAVRADLYIDETGRKVNIPQSPKRIVSLAPSVTETLFALGLDEEIVGVTTFSNYPEAARSKPRIGSYVNISLERVVSLDPDLVVGTADGNKKETIEQLERIGFPVYMINPKGLEEMFEMVLDIGRITGRDKTATDLVRTLRQRVRAVVSQTSRLRKPRVFYQIGIDPIVTVGRDTLHNKLITLAGGINVSEKGTTKYPRYGIEEIIVQKPEIIIVSSMKRGEDFDRIRNKWMKWKNIPAVKSNKIHIFNSDLTDHPSPRIIDGLEAIAKIIHPEVSFSK